MKSFWIRKENVTQELINVLHENGYKKFQDYFSENNSDILMTTYSTKHYMFAKYDLTYLDGYPHTSWLVTRDYCETSEELIKHLTDERL